MIEIYIKALTDPEGLAEQIEDIVYFVEDLTNVDTTGCDNFVAELKRNDSDFINKVCARMTNLLLSGEDVDFGKHVRTIPEDALIVLLNRLVETEFKTFDIVLVLALRKRWSRTDNGELEVAIESFKDNCSGDETIKEIWRL